MLRFLDRRLASLQALALLLQEVLGSGVGSDLASGLGGDGGPHCLFFVASLRAYT